MNLYVFEDQRFSDFFPISSTRAVFDIRFGQSTFLERIIKIFPEHSVSLIVRDEFKELVSERHANITVNPDNIEDMTPEIIEEADEHQVFYAITDELSGFSISSASNDTKDSDGNPLFIKTTWTTTGETSGDVVGYLFHEPTSKTGSTRNDFGGATDFEIEFEVHI